MKTTYQIMRIGALSLMAALCVSAFGQTVTVKRYLQSKEDFEQLVNNKEIWIIEGARGGASEIPETIKKTLSTAQWVKWDANENGLRFVGNNVSGTPNGIFIPTTETDGPFSLVNSESGFTLSMEAKLSKTDEGNSVDGGKSIAHGRLFDGTHYHSGVDKVVGNRDYNWRRNRI